MAKRNNFTSERIAGFRCPKGKQQAIYWDAKAPGLGLRVTAAGAKSYVFETRLHGKTLRVTIGNLRTWAIGKAQAEARRLKTLTDQGTDPRLLEAEKAAEAETRRKEIGRRALTVADAWEVYIKARRRKWSDRHLTDHRKIAHPGGVKTEKGDRLTEPGALAALMPLKLAEVDADQVEAWLRIEAERRPTQAALAYRLLRAFLNWCADKTDYRGIAAAGACKASIAKDVLPKKRAKTDHLQKEQLPVWFAAVRAIGNPVIGAYLQSLLLTGARREELAGLKWDDVDFRWNALTIHDKVEGERTIPLTPFVASLLAGLPRRNEWVFSSPMAASGRLQEPSIQHRRGCAVAGIDVTLHGLRRSFASLAEWTEMPAGVVAQIMGHKPSATAEKHYKQRPLDLLRLWHGKYEAWILEQAGIEFEQDQTGLKLVSIA